MREKTILKINDYMKIVNYYKIIYVQIPIKQNETKKNDIPAS